MRLWQLRQGLGHDRLVGPGDGEGHVPGAVHVEGQRCRRRRHLDDGLAAEVEIVLRRRGVQGPPGDHGVPDLLGRLALDPDRDDARPVVRGDADGHVRTLCPKDRQDAFEDDRRRCVERAQIRTDDRELLGRGAAELGREDVNERRVRTERWDRNGGRRCRPSGHRRVGAFGRRRRARRGRCRGSGRSGWT